VTPGAPPLTRRNVLLLIALGLVSGFLSGLFGIGGGILIIPFLVFLGYDIALAGAVSLLPVLVTAVVGSASYAFLGQVDWPVALLVSIGCVGGALVGTRLVRYVPARVLKVVFAAVLVLVAATLFLLVPERESDIPITLWSAAALIVVGFVVCAFAALLGLGGSFLIIPCLIILFGADDLLAKATAITVLVPTTLAQMAGDARAGRWDARTSIVVGVAAAPTIAPGALVAVAISPFVSNVLFALLLLYLTVQLMWGVWRHRRPVAAEASPSS
jgi:uncharacterized protein